MIGDVLVCLESDSIDERRAAVRAILKRRDVPSERLRALAEKYIATRTRFDVVRDATILLGRLRATEHIPWLLEHLTYRSSSWLLEDGPAPERVFPALAALIEIGAPAIRPLFTWFATHGDEPTRACVETFARHVLGRSEAIRRVAREHTSTIDPIARVHFAALLEDLHSW